MEEQFEVVKVISSYNKTTEKLIDEINIGLTLEQLKSIFIPDQDDQLMYGVYSIGYEQAIQLHRLDNTIRLDLEQFDHYVECYQASS